MFCYRDVRSYLEANYPKSLPFALKITLAFEIHGVMFSLLHCLLLPSPSSLLALNFKSAFSLQRFFGVKNLPLRGFTVGVLVFAVLFHLHERSLEIHR